MSKSKAELSISERLILTFIKFKTNNNHQFYMGNDAIALGIGIQPTTVKSIINRLVREGYLIKTIDNKGKRHLTLSGKEFIPITGNMANVDKKIAKLGQETAERWSVYYETENKRLIKENAQLDQKNFELSTQLHQLDKNRQTVLFPRLIQAELRIACMEQLFLKNGLSKEKLEELLLEANKEIQELNPNIIKTLTGYLSQTDISNLNKLKPYTYSVVIPPNNTGGVV